MPTKSRHYPDSWGPKCTAHDGVILVGQDIFDRQTLIGASCTTTLLPGLTTQTSFRVFPESSEELILVECQLDKRDRQPAANRLFLVSVTTAADGKWHATAGTSTGDGKYVLPKVAARRVDYQLYPDGIEVVTGDTRYVNYQNPPRVPGYKTRLVRNTSLLLRFIVGKVSEDELRQDSDRLTLRHQPHRAAVPEEVVLHGHQMTIQSILNVFDQGLEVQRVSRAGDLLAVRVAKGADSVHCFFLAAESMREHPDHPSRIGVIPYDYLDGSGYLAESPTAPVKGIQDLSRRLEDNPLDYGAVLSEDGLHVTAASLTLLVDMNALRGDHGTEEFIAFMGSAHGAEGFELHRLLGRVCSEPETQAVPPRTPRVGGCCWLNTTRATTNCGKYHTAGICEIPAASFYRRINNTNNNFVPDTV